MNKAEIILEQLGGKNRLVAMVAAYNFTFKKEGQLVFSFKGCRKANIFRVTLNERDLYDLKFYKMNKTTFDMLEAKTYEDVYAEDMKSMFEEFTGLYLSL